MGDGALFSCSTMAFTSFPVRHDSPAPPSFTALTWSIT